MNKQAIKNPDTLRVSVYLKIQKASAIYGLNKCNCNLLRLKC